ncbi:MAG TPA: Fmu (Sun) domain-containing protein [Puia sp.]|nr:Fmu (Sun) domain-containing protein [Puia sp.]
MRFDNQLRHAIRIIEAYQGDQPLHLWLKEFFRANKQMGSRDRKELSALVYGFYRLGHALKHLPADQRLLAGIFICLDKSNELLQHFYPVWNEKITLPIGDKIRFFQTQPTGRAFNVTDIFPWKDELPADIDHEAFCLSFLRQPDLFLRIRPGHQQTVRAKLGSIGEFIPPSTIRLPNGYKVEDHFTPDKEIVIQDYSSQRIATYLLVSKEPEFFWDACAASGGKSILAHDLYPNLHITASDIRPSILNNLKARFTAAGIHRYMTFLADLSAQPPPASAAGADLILADVPCTGSGTWSRTPEALYFFNPATIVKYRDRQRAIIRHIATQLSPGASLVYSTCSVFKKENEEMTEWIGATLGIQPELQGVLAGYRLHADTLFAARFRRS